MTFSLVPTFVPNEVMSAEKLNTYISDNLEAISDPVHGITRWQNATGGTNTMDLSNNAWTQLPTIVPIIITTTGLPLFMHFMSSVGLDAGRTVRFRFAIDGIPVTDRLHGNGSVSHATSGQIYIPVHISHWQRELEAGEHNISIEATCNSTSPMAILYEQATLLVREWS